MPKHREKPTGQYTYDLAKPCECGHTAGDHLAEGKLSEAECAKCECQGFKLKRKKNPKRKRIANPFKVLIRAVPKRGPKQIFWFDGKHFVKTKTRRAMFSSVSLATVMAKNLIRKYPILKKYDVELWSKVT